MNTRASLVSNACLFCNSWGRTLLFVGQEGNFARIVHSELAAQNEPEMKSVRSRPSLSMSVGYAVFLWAFYHVSDDRLLYRDLTRLNRSSHACVMQPLYAWFSVNTIPIRSPIGRRLKMNTSAAVSYNERHNLFRIDRD